MLPCVDERPFAIDIAGMAGLEGEGFVESVVPVRSIRKSLGGSLVFLLAGTSAKLLVVSLELLYLAEIWMLRYESFQRETTKEKSVRHTSVTPGSAQQCSQSYSWPHAAGSTCAYKNGPERPCCSVETWRRWQGRRGHVGQSGTSRTWVASSAGM